MGAFFLILIVCYCALFSFLFFVLRNIELQYSLPKQESTDSIFLSVVLAIRNEAANLLNFIEQILSQNYSRFELIVVDDHSDDDSVVWMRTLSEKYPDKIRFFILEEDQGKKAALRLAAENAKGNYIVFTDADTYFGQYWLTAYAQYISENKDDLIIGAVIFRATGWFERMQQLEFASLSASTVSLAEIKHPIMCNGANLCVKTQKYLRAIPHLKNQIASGDDMFLLHYMKKNKNKIGVLKHKEAIVYTQASKHFRQFLQQRIRWSGKSIYYSDIDTLAVALIVFFTNISLVLLFFDMLITQYWVKYFWVLFFVKMITDYIFLQEYVRKFGIKKSLLYFFHTFMIYPFYVLGVSLLSQLISKKWKKRSIH